MRLVDWLLLLSVISSCLGVASFLKSETISLKEHNACSKLSSLAYRPELNFMCQKKIKLQDARVSDFAAVDGISLKKARILVDKIRQQPIKDMQQLLAIKGIGPKSIDRLAEYFEP